MHACACVCVRVHVCVCVHVRACVCVSVREPVVLTIVLLYILMCAPFFSLHTLLLPIVVYLSFPLPFSSSSSPIAGCLLSEDCWSPSLSAPSPAEGPSCCSVDPDEVYLLTLPVGLLLAPQVERLLPGEWVM